MRLVTRPACPTCGSRSASKLVSLPYDRGVIADHLAATYGDRLDTDPLSGRDYTLRDCPGCGLVYQELAPDPDYMAHLYGAGSLDDQDAAAADRGLAVRRNYANEVEQLLVFLGRPPADVRVLDFGSGSGLWLRMAAAWGCDVAGAELSEGGRARVERLGHAAYHPDDLPAGGFDFINAEQVLEHLAEPAAAVASLARALAPGGLLRISVPNGADIRQLLADPDWTAPKGSARSLNAVAPLEHLNCFDHDSLRRGGTAAGLTPFRYPTRQYLTPMTRLRFAASALVHLVRSPRGTLQCFRRPG